MINCRICGRPLTDPDSVKRRIGPVCWKKLQAEKRKNDQIWKDAQERYSGPPRDGEIDLFDISAQIRDKEPACICGAVLDPGNLDHYGPHEGGDLVKGFLHKQWIFIHCDKCGYDMALWKIRRDLE